MRSITTTIIALNQTVTQFGAFGGFIANTTRFVESIQRAKRFRIQYTASAGVQVSFQVVNPGGNAIQFGYRNPITNIGGVQATEWIVADLSPFNFNENCYIRCIAQGGGFTSSIDFIQIEFSD